MNGPTPGAVTGTTSYRAGSGLDWQERGACRTADRDLFFVPNGERGNSIAKNEREAAAKAVCEFCPVKATCLEEALKDDLQGVWGGTNDEERRAIKREREQGQVAA